MTLTKVRDRGTTGISTDLQPIKSDISALALREATNESSASFNLPNQHIDTFTTDTLGTKTNITLDQGFVGTVIPTGFITHNSTLSTNMTQLYNFDNSLTDMVGNQNLLNNGSAVTFNSSTKKLGTHSAYFDGGGTTEFLFDDGSGGQDVPHFLNSHPPSALSMGAWFYWTPNNNDWNMVLDGYDVTSASYRNFIFTIGNDDPTATAHDKPAVWDGLDTNWGNTQDGGSDTTASTISHSTWTHIIWTLTSTKKQIFINGSLASSITGTFGFGSTATSSVAIGGRHSNSSYQYRGYIDQMAMWTRELSVTDAGYLYNSGSGNNYIAGSTNSTGTIIQDTNTVGSAKTEVGGTILYKDNQGTATLGTDLKVYFTCDGGSNWTEASSYNAITPVYSTGIKQVRLGKTTCTSGTDVRYKVEWANQSSGSKETQLHGIAINY